MDKKQHYTLGSVLGFVTCPKGVSHHNTRKLTPHTLKPLVSYSLLSPWIYPSPDPPSVCEAFRSSSFSLFLLLRMSSYSERLETGMGEGVGVC